MITSTLLIVTIFTSFSTAQRLNIPPANGDVQYARNKLISEDTDFENQEFDSDVACNEGEGGMPVFNVADGVTISNLIIGERQVDGIHCLGDCTLNKIWFRDVCEDAITVRGGDALIQGGGAQGADDKVIQHDGPPSTVTIVDFTVVDCAKLYRSCGDCPRNGGPRKVILDGLRAFAMTDDLVAINVNFGDTATIDNCCGSNNRAICQQYIGGGPGTRPGRDPGKEQCLGDQGMDDSLPPCSGRSGFGDVAYGDDGYGDDTGGGGRRGGG